VIPGTWSSHWGWWRSGRRWRPCSVGERRPLWGTPASLQRRLAPPTSCLPCTGVSASTTSTHPFNTIQCNIEWTMPTAPQSFYSQLWERGGEQMILEFSLDITAVNRNETKKQDLKWSAYLKHNDVVGVINSSGTAEIRQTTQQAHTINTVLTLTHFLLNTSRQLLGNLHTSHCMHALQSM